MQPRQRLQTYYGYAFESYCTSDTPRGRSGSTISGAPYGWGGDIDTNVQWCSVVRTKLGDNRMIIGGEVDCVRGLFPGFWFLLDPNHSFTLQINIQADQTHSWN